ncbi:hypothetical protein EPO44_14165 [bacterium]|nr:MAG: hypothetical protein EPO44_14165 [bacterium]
MKSMFFGIFALLFSFVLVSPISAQEKKAEKQKAEKASGDVGLLDLEKNYMILVTKEGKLVTLDFDKKTKVTVLKEEKAKMGDIGLGSSASIVYTEKNGKNTLSSLEFLPAKGGD